MNKKVLAIYYSQTGQLGDIIDHFTAPLAEAGATIEKVLLRPAPGYPFPWTSERFFDVMPDCVLGVPGSLDPFTLKEERYDLVILGYQAWFLSPCIPVNTLLQDPAFAGRIKDTPVITITGARNMWINAYSRLCEILKEKEALHVGNIALVDRHLNLVSFVTILYWMFGGKKDRYLNIFPRPGVSEKDIEAMGDYGKQTLPFLQSAAWEGLQPALVTAGAVEVREHLLFIERNGGRIFGIWARMIVRRKNRKPWLSAFKYYIIFALVLLGPLVYLFTKLLVKPIFSRKVNAAKNYYLYLN